MQKLLILAILWTLTQSEYIVKEHSAATDEEKATETN